MNKKRLERMMEESKKNLKWKEKKNLYLVLNDQKVSGLNV